MLRILDVAKPQHESHPEIGQGHQRYTQEHGRAQSVQYSTGQYRTVHYSTFE